MKRIIIHWTAGTNTASALDKHHYHFIVEGNGNVVAGRYKPEDNESTATDYAPHTRSLNTGSIGVSFAAMHGATERPFIAGKYPITKIQIDEMVNLVADLCIRYGIEVFPWTVLTHAEVEGTLNIKQRGKWDVTWLPGMTQPGHPDAVGGLLREKMRLKLNAMRSPKPKPTIWDALARIFAKWKKP